MLNTKFNPGNLSEINNVMMKANNQGVIGSCPAGATNIDFTPTSDTIITMINIVAQNCNWGDYLDCKVVDVSGTYFPAGTVVTQVITSAYMSSESKWSLSLYVDMPVKVLGGLTIRMIYTNTGSNIVGIAFNYHAYDIQG